MKNGERDSKSKLEKMEKKDLMIEDKQLFNINFSEILDYYPEEIPILVSAEDGTVRIIKRLADGSFCDDSNKTPYAKENLLYDITQRRVSLSALLTPIEKSKDYRLDVDLRTGLAIGNLTVHKPQPRGPTVNHKKGINKIKKIVAEKKNAAK